LLAGLGEIDSFWGEEKQVGNYGAAVMAVMVVLGDFGVEEMVVVDNFEMKIDNSEMGVEMGVEMQRVY